MMKISTKPMSSPSRTEKFPPPLMLRFLRSNVESKSRGRSRSSPMFPRKKNAVIETQEPSSPKVTCIGQVRARRSSKQSGSKSGGRSGPVRAPMKKGSCSCLRVRNPLSCPRLTKRFRPRSICPNWRKCVSFFRFGCCRRSIIGENLSEMASNRNYIYKKNDSKEEDQDQDEDEEEDENEGEVEEAQTEAFGSSSPPKNALLLTRCRSAPYRSSSIGSRFLGLTTLETEHDRENSSPQQQPQQLQEIGPSLEREPDIRYSTSESKTDQETEGTLGISLIVEDTINGQIEEPETGDGARPLILSRSKSEPARTGERLTPAALFVTCL